MFRLRFVFLAAGLALLGLAGFFAWFYIATRPVVAGVLRVAGAQAPIEIRRDTDGVAHIVAASERDLAFGLGFAQAQDRLWQLDFHRRLAAGRLAEVLGHAALDTDRFMRTVGLYNTARASVELLHPASRDALDGFAAGVNAYLANRRGPLPLEYWLTRTPAPEPWTPADSLAWAMLMALDLSSQSMRNEVRRLRLTQRLSTAEIADLMPTAESDPPGPTLDFANLYRIAGVTGPALPRGRAAAAALPTFAGFGGDVPTGPFGAGEGIGSNNWVLGSERTATGRPMLANDPHLGLSAPSIWYFAALSAPGVEAIGATLPGLPVVVLGRNARVAWGVTNTGPDVQDLFLERVHPTDPAQYQTPDGWATFDRSEELIRVRGAAPVLLAVRSTRHGPVLSDLPQFSRLIASVSPDGNEPTSTRAGIAAPRAASAGASPPSASRFVLTLQWSELEPSGDILAPARALNVARDALEVREALRGWKMATQNFVYADVDGAIGFQVAGRVPVRRADNDLLGIAPAPGWDARYDWVGWLPFDALPHETNPVRGFVGTANQKVTPPGAAYFLTADWPPAWRAERIAQLIEARPRHDMASMQAMQADVQSLPARTLITLLRNTEPRTAAGREALARLLNWDFNLRADAPEGLLYWAWMRELKQRIFADDLGDLAAELVTPVALTEPLIAVLAGRARARDWCDDVTTRQRFESCATLAAEALDDAVTALTQASGSDVAGLRWGDAHIAVAEHRPLSSVPVVGRLFELRVPWPGDTDTLNVGAVSQRPAAPFATRHAASFRAIYDLADPARSVWMGSAGQSGDRLSARYSSMLERWGAVHYMPMQAAPVGTRDTLRLEPSTSRMVPRGSPP